MRGNEFLDKMELVDPAYVEEADQQPQKARKPWLKWGGLAACLCVAAVSVFALTGLDPVVMWRNLTGTYDPALVDDVLPSNYPGPITDDDEPHPIDPYLPKPPTSETYSSLTELLEDLRLHDGHTLTEAQVDSLDRYSTAHAAMEGADTVSWEDAVYQLNHDMAKRVGVYQDGVLVGTLDVPADYLFVSGGRLITVGAEYYSGTELDPVYCVRVNIFGLDNPAHPEKLDAFTQLGDLTACWMNNDTDTLYLMTDDGVCACGYSRFSNLEDYKPQSFHGEEPFPWPDGSDCILGKPSRVSYVAAVCIDVENLEVTAQRAFYGDIEDVYFGPDWFAFVTSTSLEYSYTLQDVYTFDGFLDFTGKLDLAEEFGLEKTVKWSKTQDLPRTAQRPEVKAVNCSEGIWRMVGEHLSYTGTSWYRVLFAITFDPETNGTAGQILQLPEEQFDIDDVLWEEDRAIISAGFVRFDSDPYERCTRLAFAEFDGMGIELMASDILCDRVTGIDMMYGYGSPLGHIRPFISLPNGLYLRYNGTPDGFDVYDLSDSHNPKCLYKSQGDIPEGCRLDFDNCVLDTRVLDTGGSTSSVAVKLITPKDGEYRNPDYSWRVFLVSSKYKSTVPELLPQEYPVTGTDPAAIRPFES